MGQTSHSGGAIEPGEGTSSPLTLVSTRTIDALPLPNGERREMPGGPAHYIGTALARLGMSYHLITGAVAQVEVIPDPGGEQQYRIPALPTIRLPARLEGPAAIFSPVMREIQPTDLPPIAGLLALDLQGFVRQPGMPTREGPPVDLTELLTRADIVKGSEDELGRLSEHSLAALDQAIVLDTMGIKGALIRYCGREVHVPADPVHAPHTIGAGDMYLAAFVQATLQGYSPVEAGNRAARFTEGVLRERLEPGTT